jgi:hypothetical protein
MCSSPLRLFGGTVQLNCAVVDRGHEFAQRLDRIVDRVGNRTGDILSHRCLHRQIAVGQARQLIQQAHDRFLVALVFAHP